MTLPTIEHIAQLPHAELVALVTEVIVAVQRWEAEHQQLTAELAKASPPPPTAQNSSQPSSREMQRNVAGQRTCKKHGPPVGHARWTRRWVAEPDRILAASVESGGHGQADLRGGEPRAIRRHPLPALPPITPVVLEPRQAEVVCPDCGRITRGERPAGHWSQLKPPISDFSAPDTTKFPLPSWERARERERMIEETSRSPSPVSSPSKGEERKTERFRLKL